MNLNRNTSTPPVSPAAEAPELEENEDESSAARMTFLEHLDELRKRVTRAFFALIVGTVIGFALARPVLLYLQQPYGERFQVLDPTGSVISFFRVSLLVGGIISIPIITYQLLMFIFPALLPKERRMLLTALPAITGLFLLGAAFAWFVLVPPALNFLQQFQGDIFFIQWEADSYLGFVTALIFWMGVAFETPLVFFVLSLLGLVTPKPLIKNWRIAVIGTAVAAAAITPTVDPVNMFLVMGPLMVLYFFSIILTAVGQRITTNRADESAS